MELRTIRHKIANVRRHFGINGSDLLACYDTAIVALTGDHTVDYITLSVAPSRWKALADRLDLDTQVKHPGSNVPCLKVFNDVYIRAEHFIKDEDVRWSKHTRTYTPTIGKLVSQMEAVIMASKSTKKQLEHATHVLKVTMQ